MSSSQCTLVVLLATLTATPISAQAAPPPRYGDDLHLRVDLGVGASSVGLRGELGFSAAYSLLVASLRLGGASALADGVADITGGLGLGFDASDVVRVELAAELGTRSVTVDASSGMFSDGPQYDYTSPHLGVRFAIDMRLGSRNDGVHARLGVAVFLRADLDRASPSEDSYLDCGGGFNLFDDGDDDCRSVAFTRVDGGQVEGGAMLRLALDLPL